MFALPVSARYSKRRAGSNTRLPKPAKSVTVAFPSRYPLTRPVAPPPEKVVNEPLTASLMMRAPEQENISLEVTTAAAETPPTPSGSVASVVIVHAVGGSASKPGALQAVKQAQRLGLAFPPGQTKPGEQSEITPPEQ